jgi:hypothetical protein
MKSFLVVLLLSISFGAVADQSVCDKLKGENATPEQLAQRGGVAVLVDELNAESADSAHLVGVMPMTLKSLS